MLLPGVVGAGQAAEGVGGCEGEVGGGEQLAVACSAPLASDAAAAVFFLSETRVKPRTWEDCKPNNGQSGTSSLLGHIRTLEHLLTTHTCAEDSRCLVHPISISSTL